MANHLDLVAINQPPHTGLLQVRLPAKQTAFMAVMKLVCMPCANDDHMPAHKLLN